jgi:hypothetical protein
MNGGIINSVTRLHLVGCFYWDNVKFSNSLLVFVGNEHCHVQYFTNSLVAEPEVTISILGSAFGAQSQSHPGFTAQLSSLRSHLLVMLSL